MFWLIIYVVGGIGWSITHFVTERGRVHFDDATVGSALFVGITWPLWLPFVLLLGAYIRLKGD
jgi:hypothetical protein